LRGYSHGAPITFTLLAVTDEQIYEWDLPTRPPKKDGDPPAVELDAIPPDKLTTLVDDAIRQHVDDHAWAIEEQAEAQGREVLGRIAIAVERAYLGDEHDDQERDG
jgi:hypothetical protein